MNTSKETATETLPKWMVDYYEKAEKQRFNAIRVDIAGRALLWEYYKSMINKNPSKARDARMALRRLLNGDTR